MLETLRSPILQKCGKATLLALQEESDSFNVNYLNCFVLTFAVLLSVTILAQKETQPRIFFGAVLTAMDEHVCVRPHRTSVHFLRRSGVSGGEMLSRFAADPGLQFSVCAPEKRGGGKVVNSQPFLLKVLGKLSSCVTSNDEEKRKRRELRRKRLPAQTEKLLER